MAEAKEEQAAKPKNTGKILTLVFAVVNLAVMGGGTYLVYASTLGYKKPSYTEADAARELASIVGEAETGPLIYTMEKFTVNLSGEPKRTIRLEVNLQMLGEEGFEEIMNSDNKARTRDQIVKILNEKTFTDLDSVQGKLFLKDEISKELNGVLKKGVVKDVFFSDFVVQ